jgi:hypothetical protein
MDTNHNQFSSTHHQIMTKISMTEIQKNVVWLTGYSVIGIDV